LVGCPQSERIAPAGMVVGESTTQTSLVLFDKASGHTPRVGMQVMAETGSGCILGVVEKLWAGNPFLPGDAKSYHDVASMASYRDLGNTMYLRGLVRWYSLLDPLEKGGRVESPTVPPEPASRIYPVPKSVLEGIFAPRERAWVRIGSLVWGGAEFRVNIDALARHLAILAVTGGGKSNTVCVLVRRIVRDLNGTVVIFDMHGEYAASDLAGERQVVLEPKINPVNLTVEELFHLAQIRENAVNQMRVLREVWEDVTSRYYGGGLAERIDATMILEKLVEELENGGRALEANRKKGEAKIYYSVAEKVKDMLRVYGSVLDGRAPIRLDDYILPGRLNIVDLSSIDDNGADAVASHLLRRILQERKRWRMTGDGYPVPVIAVLEEAHILVPRNSSSLTKYWAGRVAREGRKFQVGMVLVSQRPKNVDDDVLSQTNNKIFLRIVEPHDLAYVQATTEQMSEDLKELLPGLSPGEAVVVGMMTRLPAVVKIDLCKGKKAGGDVSLTELWGESSGGGELDDVF